MKFKLLFKNAFSTDNVHLHDTVHKCYMQSQYECIVRIFLNITKEAAELPMLGFLHRYWGP